jgi:hypothetical protein
VIIGFGLTLYTLGGWLTSLGSHPPMGWVAYSPLSTEDPFGGFHPWLRLIVWLVLIVLWVFASTALLRT